MACPSLPFPSLPFPSLPCRPLRCSPRCLLMRILRAACSILILADGDCVGDHMRCHGHENRPARMAVCHNGSLCEASCFKPMTRWRATQHAGACRRSGVCCMRPVSARCIARRIAHAAGLVPPSDEFNGRKVHGVSSGERAGSQSAMKKGPTDRRNNKATGSVRV